MKLKLGIIALCAFSTAFLTDEEVDIILTNLKRLKIGKCILTFETDVHVENIKKLNAEYIITGYLTPKMLELYATEMRHSDAAIAVVMKNKTCVKSLFLKGYENLLWFTWFLISDDDLYDVNIPINCQFFQIKRGANGSYSVVESYKLKNVFVRDDFGVWSPVKGFNATPLTMYQRRTDFRGVALKIKNCGRHNYIRFTEFYEDMGRILNFTIENNSKDGKEKNSSLGKEDVSSCILTVTGMEDEKEWVFIHFNIKVAVATKFRGTNDVGCRAYLTPFTNDMWMAVSAWLFVSTTAIIIIKGCRKYTIYENILTGLFCLCNTDPMVTHPPSEPLQLSTQLVYLMLLTVPSIIIPAYSGYILSTLSYVLPLTPFIDLRSFIKIGTFTLTAPENSFALRILERTRHPDMKYIFEHLFKGTSKSYADQFEKLCEDPTLAGLFPNIYPMYDMFKCKMYIMPGLVPTLTTALLFPKGSPFRAFIKKRYRWCAERGVKYESRARSIPEDKSENTESLNSLNMSQMKAIFCLIPLGVALALVILIIERMVAKRRQQERQRNE